MVVVSSAIKRDNPELQAARERMIDTLADAVEHHLDLDALFALASRP